MPGLQLCMYIFVPRKPARDTCLAGTHNVALEIADAIRDKCPDVILNFSTGTIGRDQSGPLACVRAGKPEIAACNAGSLNYLKSRSSGTWAWPPMVFDNPVDKVEELLKVCRETGTRPEFECFDIGIVRSVGMYADVGMVDKPNYNLVMGVASGMPADPELLQLMPKYMKPKQPLAEYGDWA